MSLIKRDVVELQKRAVNSLVLAIELFNRPYDAGRAESVIILLHHAFEMLLKAKVTALTGNVHDASGKYSYGFDKCLEISQTKKVISPDERTALSILDAHRDTAVHFYQELSEDLLYMQAQVSVTLFNDLLKRFFKRSLADCIPERVLPVSTRPPKDLQILIDSELSQVDALLKKGYRKGFQAAAKLRPILALASASRSDAERVSEQELRQVIVKRRRGKDWGLILPEVAQLKLNTEGKGIPIYLRITKNEGVPFRIAKDGEKPIGTVVKKEIDIWDKYNMGLYQLAEKLGLTAPKVSALIVELKLQDDAECYKVLTKKSITMKGYSKLALDKLREAMASGIDVDKTWQKHKALFSRKKKR